MVQYLVSPPSLLPSGKGFTPPPTPLRNKPPLRGRSYVLVIACFACAEEILCVSRRVFCKMLSMKRRVFKLTSIQNLVPSLVQNRSQILSKIN